MSSKLLHSPHLLTCNTEGQNLDRTACQLGWTGRKANMSTFSAHILTQNIMYYTNYVIYYIILHVDFYWTTWCYILVERTLNRICSWQTWANIKFLKCFLSLLCTKKHNSGNFQFYVYINTLYRSVLNDVCSRFRINA